MPGKKARFVEVRERDGRTLQLPACVKCDYPVKREDLLSFEGDAFHKYCFKCALTGKNLVGEEVVVWRGQPYLKAALEGKDIDDVKYVDIWTNGGQPIVEGAEFLPNRPPPINTYGVRSGYYTYGGQEYPLWEYPPEYDYGYTEYTDYPDRGYTDYGRGYDYGRSYTYGYPGYDRDYGYSYYPRERGGRGYNGRYY